MPRARGAHGARGLLLAPVAVLRERWVRARGIGGPRLTRVQFCLRERRQAAPCLPSFARGAATSKLRRAARGSLPRPVVPYSAISMISMILVPARCGDVGHRWRLSHPLK